MKVLKKLLVITLIALIGVTMMTFSSKNNPVVAEEDLFTVTVVNGNEKGGNVTIAIKEGDSYTDTGLTTVQVKAGTKIKMWFQDGLNEGYEIYCWASASNGVLTTVSGSDGQQYYTEPKFIQTIKNDLTMYVYPKSAEEHIVAFYDSTLLERRSLLGLAMVKDGEAADMAGVIEPLKKGFDLTGWSKDLNHVRENLEVIPSYTSNVWTVFRDYYPMFFKGLLNTMILSVISVSMALVAGMFICLIRLSNIKLLKFIAGLYVEVIRGVPLLLQLLLVYALLGPTKISIGSYFSTEVLSCILTLFINSSAYTSEIFRSGIQAVDKGQMEAGRALGMSQWQVYKNIIIPQGVRNSLPSIVNELIAMIKETSLAVNIDVSIAELMSVRKTITAATFINLPAFFVVALIYFCVTFTLSKVVGLIEKRLSAHD